MKIEIWSDIGCPFCYIGKRKLDEALAAFPYKEQVEIVFKSYELDPNAPLYDGGNMYEKLAAKFGTSVEQAKQMTSGISEQAAQVGLVFDFAEAKTTNTFDAHRLTKFAGLHGKEEAIMEKLYAAHFTEGQDVGDVEVLADIAEAAGLDKEEALEVLRDKTFYANEVRADQEEAKQFGISGVPYFIINRKYAISGAQPTETFAGALQKVWEEKNAAPQLQNLSPTGDDNDDPYCADGSCAVPPKQ